MSNRVPDVPVAGIVLAAGLSTRMGRPKLLLPFGDTTLLGWAVRQAEASSLDEVIVVTSADPNAARALAGSGARSAINHDPVGGSVTSLMVGAAAAKSPTLMVLPADMPGLDSTIIDTVLTAWRTRPSWAGVTDYRDGTGHPLVLSPQLMATLAGERGDKVLWPMLAGAQADTVLRVPIDRLRPRDVNTPEDYREACRALGLEPAVW